jgi:hypothetical protein
VSDDNKRKELYDRAMRKIIKDEAQLRRHPMTEPPNGPEMPPAPEIPIELLPNMTSDCELIEMTRAMSGWLLAYVVHVCRDGDERVRVELIKRDGGALTEPLMDMRMDTR